MGYYTNFVLSTNTDGDRHKEIIADLRSDDNKNAYFGLTPDGFTNEPIKWYDAEKDIIEFSKKYPDVLFTLYGDGESGDDHWICYIQNGKSQHCNGEIVYPPYDPEKMM